MTFIVQQDAVYLTGDHPPWRMSDGAVDAMLDQLETDGERGDLGAWFLFNRLYEAQKLAMGPLHIARVISFEPRLVVDNGASKRLRLTVVASVEQLGNGA